MGVHLEGGEKGADLCVCVKKCETVGMFGLIRLHQIAKHEANSAVIKNRMVDSGALYLTLLPTKNAKFSTRY